MKIDSIFLSHWHGDHALGLGGLMQSLSLQERERDLDIYGPKGTNKKLKHLIKAFPFSPSFRIRAVSLEYKEPKTVVETDEYKIEAVNIEHKVKALAYSFKQKDKRRIDVEYTKQFGLENHPKLGELQRGKSIEWEGREITPEEATYIEEGKRITYTGDGRPGERVKELAKGSDILISEATFSSEMEDKARKTGHLTTKEAAKFAKEAGAKKLILTHFSRRFRDLEKLKKEAEEIFDNVVLAEDLMRIKLKA